MGVPFSDKGYTSLELLASLEPTVENFSLLGFSLMPDQTMYRMKWVEWKNKSNKPEVPTSSKYQISSEEFDTESNSSEKESVRKSPSGKSACTDSEYKSSEEEKVCKSSPGKFTSTNDTKAGSCNPLRNVLNQSSGGRLLLRVGSQRELKRNEQSELCNIILDHLLKDRGDQKPKLPYKTFSEWAKHVHNLFPTEPEAIWFCISPALKLDETRLSVGAKAPESASARPHGKLYDRYGKRQAIWRESRGLVKKKPSGLNETVAKDALCSEDSEEVVRKSAKGRKPKLPLSDEQPQIEDKLEQNEDIVTILNYQGQELSNILETAWRQTWLLRKDYLLKCSPTDYMNKFPLLRLPNIGPYLIDIDFTTIHPGISPSALYTGLRKSAEFIEARASNKLRSLNKVARAQQTKIHDLPTDTEQQKVTKALLLLPFAIVGGKTGARTKASRFDAASHFIYFAKTRSEGEAHLECLREEAATKPFAGVQPLVVAVGEELSTISSAYTVIDNVWIFSQSLVEAVDLCFKVFYIFDLQYPKSCEHIWQLLQFLCYHIKHDGQDKYIIDINKFMNEIEIIQERDNSSPSLLPLSSSPLPSSQKE